MPGSTIRMAAGSPRSPFMHTFVTSFSMFMPQAGSATARVSLDYIAGLYAVEDEMRGHVADDR